MKETAKVREVLEIWRHHVARWKVRVAMVTIMVLSESREPDEALSDRAECKPIRWRFVQLPRVSTTLSLNTNSF